MKLSILLVVLCLSACKTALFDNNEYMLVAQIKQSAMAGIIQCSQEPADAFIDHGNDIYNNAQLYEIYSQHRANNQQSYKMASALEEMSQIFTTRPDTVSKEYCIQKFTHIRDAADLVLSSLAKENSK